MSGIRSLRPLLVAAAMLGTVAPVYAAAVNVYVFDSSPLSITDYFGFASASTPTNLAEPTPAGFLPFGFDVAMVYNNAGGNPAAPVTLAASGLPAHTSLNLEFLLAVIDSWDGSTTAGGTVPPDYFNVRLDGTLIYSETFDNFLIGDQSAGIGNRLSYGSNLGFSGWPDAVYDFTGATGLLAIPHSASSFVIDFFASGAGWQGGGDESFGLDRIKVSVNVPEPASLALLGLGLAGLAMRRRRKN